MLITKKKLLSKASVRTLKYYFKIIFLKNHDYMIIVSQLFYIKKIPWWQEPVPQPHSRKTPLFYGLDTSAGNI